MKLDFQRLFQSDKAHAWFLHQQKSTKLWKQTQKPPIALIIIQSYIPKEFWILNNPRSFTKIISGLILCFFQCSCADSAGGAALLTISLMTIACVAMFKRKVNANDNTNAAVWQQWVIVWSQMSMAVRQNSSLTNLFASLAPLPSSFSTTRRLHESTACTNPRVHTSILVTQIRRYPVCDELK